MKAAAHTMISVVWIVLILTFVSSPGTRAQITPLKDTKNTRQLVKQIYTSQAGIRESMPNSGPEVEKYLRYVNLPKGKPWCAAFVCWVYGQAGVSNPRTGWSPSLFPAEKVIWLKAQSSKLKAESSDRLAYPPSQATGNRKLATEKATPTTGDIFGIYFPHKKRIAHVGFVDSWDGTWMITVEGNTNSSGSREGDGVYRKRRLVSTIYKVARYIN